MAAIRPSLIGNFPHSALPHVGGMINGWDMRGQREKYADLIFFFLIIIFFLQKKKKKEREREWKKKNPWKSWLSLSLIGHQQRGDEVHCVSNSQGLGANLMFQAQQRTKRATGRVGWWWYFTTHDQRTYIYPCVCVCFSSLRLLIHSLTITVVTIIHSTPFSKLFFRDCGNAYTNTRVTLVW
jgi:hypothetical protein